MVCNCKPKLLCLNHISLGWGGGRDFHLKHNFYFSFSFSANSLKYSYTDGFLTHFDGLPHTVCWDCFGFFCVCMLDVMMPMMVLRKCVKRQKKKKEERNKKCVPYQSVLKGNVIYFPTSYFRHLFRCLLNRMVFIECAAVNISRQKLSVEITNSLYKYLTFDDSYKRDEWTPCWKTEKKIFWKFFSAYCGSMYWIF